MQDEQENLKAVVSVGQKVNHLERDKNFPDINISELIASIFNPGKFFYILINFFDLRIEYVHRTTEELLGLKPEDVNFEALFQIMHPDDAFQMKLKEEAAAAFFYNRIPVHKIPLYKSTYTIRLRDAEGKYKVFLVQNIALTVTDGRIHHVLTVMTDVTFMNLAPDNRISFIGINGEPSYYSLSTDPNTILQPEKELTLSPREREIVKLLSEGLASKQIGAALGISTHTVDTYRRKLLKKTGAKNTLELAVACYKKGLI